MGQDARVVFKFGPDFFQTGFYDGQCRFIHQFFDIRVQRRCQFIDFHRCNLYLGLDQADQNGWRDAESFEDLESAVKDYITLEKFDLIFR